MFTRLCSQGRPSHARSARTPQQHRRYWTHMFHQRAVRTVANPARPRCSHPAIPAGPAAPRHPRRFLALPPARNIEHCLQAQAGCVAQAGPGLLCPVLFSSLGGSLMSSTMFFISDPGNFQLCMSVDAIPVLPPCGDRLKKGGAAGPREKGKGNAHRGALRGALSYRGAFNKPACGLAHALDSCLRRPGGMDLHRHLPQQPSFSRPRSSSRSGERRLPGF